MIFVSAPKTEALRARMVARQIQLRGGRVTSGWHDIVEPADTDPIDHQDASAILVQNVFDLRSARAMIVLWSREANETRVEIGRAIERGIKIFWSLEKDSDCFPLSSHDDNCVRSFPSDAEAIEACLNYCQRQANWES